MSRGGREIAEGSIALIFEMNPEYEGKIRCRSWDSQWQSQYREACVGCASSIKRTIHGYRCSGRWEEVLAKEEESGMPSAKETEKSWS